MTIPSITSRVTYIGNGSASQFAYTFKIFSESDLLITVADSDDAETTLVLTTDYTVSGVKKAAGGDVTLVDRGQAWLDASGNLETGFTLTIRRVRELKQETDFRNQGAFFPETHENAFDHSVMLDHQQQDELDRSLKLPESETGTAAKTTIPSVADRTDKVLGFDASGNPTAVANVPTSGVTATAYTETLLDDADAAAARATLEVFEEISPASLAADQNDYAGANSDAQHVLVRLTSSVDVKITGLTAGTAGQVKTIVNIGANNITLADENGGSTATARVITGAGADLTLGPNERTRIIYDGTSGRWRMIG